MHKWVGKVAVVTGASSGIGASITRALARQGVLVVGLARREERVKEIADELKGARGKVYPLKVDLVKEDEVISAFSWIRENLGGADILINNAGTTAKISIAEGEIERWRQIYELNVLAVGTCISEFLKDIKSRGIDDGHIINIGSVAGHRFPLNLKNVVYASTKFAAKVITEGLRLELAEMKSKIKVTNLSPGLVDTEIFVVGNFVDEYKDQASTILKPDEVADAVSYVLSTPPNVLISELIIRPTGEGW